MKFWWYWIVIVFCLLVSILVSASDVIYSLVDTNKLQKLVDKGNKKAKKALDLATQYESTLSSLLFWDNVVNILASTLVTLIAVSIDPEIGPSIATISFTIILIVFCEFLPKSIGKRFNFSLSIALAPFIKVAVIISNPITYLVSKLFKSVNKLFRKTKEEEDKIDEEVLNEMVDTIEEDGKIESNEAEVLRNAIDLSDVEAYEIMTPRVDLVAIDINDSIEDILSNKEAIKRSRIPVFDGTIDNIVGILPSKLLAKYVLSNTEFSIKELCYEPIVIPRNTQILDLLEEFKKSKVHIAVVIDEYGGTEGIITMEDILEEIVGEIYDEKDSIEEEYKMIAPNVYEVSGSYNIDDFFELVNYDEEVETNYTTVGGFCQDILKRFAKTGDKFKFANLSFEVLEADEYTAQKLLVKVGKHVKRN